MKLYIVLVVTLLVILSLSYWQMSYLEKTKHELKQTLSNLQNEIDEEKYEKTVMNLTKLKEYWKVIQKGWDVFAEHDDVEQVSCAIESLQVYIVEKEKAQALNECVLLLQRLEHIVFSEKLNISNVF